MDSILPLNKIQWGCEGLLAEPSGSYDLKEKNSRGCAQEKDVGLTKLQLQTPKHQALKFWPGANEKLVPISPTPQTQPASRFWRYPAATGLPLPLYTTTTMGISGAHLPQWASQVHTFETPLTFPSFSGLPGDHRTLRGRPRIKIKLLLCPSSCLPCFF